MLINSLCATNWDTLTFQIKEVKVIVSTCLNIIHSETLDAPFPPNALYDRPVMMMMTMMMVMMMMMMMIICMTDPKKGRFLLVAGSNSPSVASSRDL